MSQAKRKFGHVILSEIVDILIVDFKEAYKMILEVASKTLAYKN